MDQPSRTVAERVPDCLGLELSEALARLKSSGRDVVVHETTDPQGAHLTGPQRVIRQKLLPSGQIELVVAYAS